MGKYSKYTKKYNPEWEKEPLFKGWLQESTNKIGAYCKICHRELRAHKNDLKKHASCDMHEKNLKKYGFTSSNNQRNLTDLGVSTTSTVTTDMKKLELQFATYVAFHSSIHGIDHLTNIVNKNELTVKSIHLHRTKCAALIKNVISPALKSDILNEIGSSSYSLIVDESTDVSTCKYMAVCIRYFSHKSYQMRTDYLGIFEVTKATAAVLYDSLKLFLSNNNLDYKKIIGIGTDGASNMVGEFNSLYALLKKDVPSLLLVKCVCHSIHLCGSHASKELPSALDYMVRETYSWFNNSTLRKCEYEKIYKLINENTKPLKLNKPCTTRWLSLYECVDKILDQYDELKLHFELSSTKEKCYAARLLSEMYKDQINYLYLIFLKPILKELHDTNVLFQSESADVEVIYENLKSLIISVCSRILTPLYINYLHEQKWSLFSVKSTLDNVLSFSKLDQVDYGFIFQNKLTEMKDKISPQDVISIKTRCFNYLKCLANELVARMPNNMHLLEKLKYFSPKFCLNQTRVKFNELPLQMLGDNKLTDILQLETEWRNLLSVDWTCYFPNGVITDDTIEFWKTVLVHENAIKDRPFSNLAQSVLNLLSIPISNAVVERTFSVMNAIKIKTRNRMNFTTLDSILRIRLYCYARKICCDNLSVTETMLDLFTSRMYLAINNDNETEGSELVDTIHMLDDESN